MVNLLCNKLFVLAPVYLKNSAENAVPIMTVSLFLVTFIELQLISRLSEYNFDLLDLISSKTLKLIVGTVIITAIATVTILTLRQYCEGIKVMALPKSPIYFIVGFFTVAMIIGTLCGLNSIGKVCSFFVPIIYFVAIILTLATFNKNDVYNLFPVFGRGISVVFSQSILMLSMLFELIILFFLPPLLKYPEDFKKIGNLTVIWSFLCFFVIGSIYAISSVSQSENYEPFFRLIKQIEFGNFLQRFDSVFLILYCISALLYLSSMLFFLTHITAKLFEIKKMNELIIPVGLIIASAATVNILEEYMFNILENTNYVLWIIAFVLPPMIIITKKVWCPK